MTYDAIVIGSGFGGAFAALPLVEAGAKVLMLERGDWVPRSSGNWLPQGTLELTPFFSSETPYRVLAGGRASTTGMCECVGGPSVFYGGVSFRMRPADFLEKSEIIGESGARWPLGYADLERHYERAEQILQVTGETGQDPTEPPGFRKYPRQSAKPTGTACMVADAGRALGLRPFLLPLAIHSGNEGGRTGCAACATCDSFACAVSAKNDLATTVLPGLMRKGLELRSNTVAVRLVAEGRRIAAVECVDKKGGGRLKLRADTFFLAAGALATPHLLLASNLHDLNPAGPMVGRYLTRHCNGIVFGVFPKLPDRGEHFHKQYGFHDFYFGHPGITEPRGMLGSIQQVQTPPPALVRTYVPAWTHPIVRLLIPRMTGLLVMAEDQPRMENGVSIDRARTDRFGMPQLEIRHVHTGRDLAARRALYGQAGRILRKAGARLLYSHDIRTFSHATGTVRLGDDPRSAPLDPLCRFRGVDNLLVVDASVMPTSGGVNPSLTIAANALRVGAAVARGMLAAVES
jgi:choline dehydrogenase-like flavoprotein